MSDYCIRKNEVGTAHISAEIYANLIEENTRMSQAILYLIDDIKHHKVAYSDYALETIDTALKFAGYGIDD